jgi:hypothetical protein
MSASGIDGVPEEQIWQIGDEAGRSRSKSALARADFKPEAVSGIQADGAKLTIEPDPQPHDLKHVNLCGWPADKDLRLSIAQELSVKSMLRLRPEGD